MTGLTIDKRDGLFVRLYCTDSGAIIDIAVNDADDVVFSVHGMDGAKTIKLPHEDSISLIQALSA